MSTVAYFVYISYCLILILLTIFKRFVGYRSVLILTSFMLLLQVFYYTLNILTFTKHGLVITLAIPVNYRLFNLLDLSILLKLDILSFFFYLLVVVIGFCTNIYILNYFKGEANVSSFVLLINWFIFSMILLVLADNLFTLYLAWELIGLTSFFLINFWHERQGTIKSSFKAFIFNKISDAFLLIFIVLMCFLINVSSISTLTSLNQLPLNTNNSLVYIAGLSLIICSCFKSAQLGFHLWLPDSMEAPVPASALIHSATLVSAGFYLLLRFSNLILLLNLMSIISILGALTAVYGGITSALQTDVKKLLAYSTISHCGFLFVTISLNKPELCIIYLYLHGLFKAATFFCVGSFIRFSNNQDMRYMGNISKFLPVDTIFLVICSVNLGGLPLTLGFIYKNFFFQYLMLNYVNFFTLSCCFVGMLTSIVYTYKLIYYTVFDWNKQRFTLSTLHLQNISTEINNFRFWSYSTFIQIFVLFFILSFSLFIVIFFIVHFNVSYLDLNFLPIRMSVDSTSKTILQLNYASYFNIFYFVYLVIFFIIIFFVWRFEFSFFTKLMLLVFCLIFILLLNFLDILVFFIFFKFFM